jgi:LacI family transcriptional regulator
MKNMPVNGFGRNPVLKRTFRFLHRHWHRPINTDDLVVVSKISRRGLYKTFVKHVGHGPGRELRQIRIRHAQELLARTPCNLTNIAEMCGFRNVNTFYVAFKRETGASPGKWRKVSGRAANRRFAPFQSHSML